MKTIEIEEKDIPLKVNYQELIQDLATAWAVPISDISITHKAGGILILENKEGVTETVEPAKLIIEVNTDKAIPDALTIVKDHMPEKSTAEKSVIEEKLKDEGWLQSTDVIKEILARLNALEAGK